MGSPRPSSAEPTGRVVPVGRFFGVPVYFAPSWVLIVVLITIFYSRVFLDAVQDSTVSTSYVVAFSYALLLAVSVLAHELGHTAVSLLLGHPVKRIVIIMLGGVSELHRDIERPRDEFLVAIAGPVVSLLMAAAAWAAVGGFEDGSSWSALFVLLALSNLVIAVFNLLPGLPLDGGRILRAVVWRFARSRLTGTRAAAYAGRIIAAALFVLSGLLIFTDFGFVAGVVGLVSAAFIWVGAGHSLFAAVVSESLPELSVRRLMRPGVMVHSDVSVAEALRRAWDTRAGGILVMDAADRPRALVDEALIRAVPDEQRAWTPVTEVARTLRPGLELPVSLTGQELLDAMRDTPANEYLVIGDDGTPAGILAAADFGRAVQRAAQ